VCNPGHEAQKIQIHVSNEEISQGKIEKSISKYKLHAVQTNIQLILGPWIDTEFCWLSKTECAFQEKNRLSQVNFVQKGDCYDISK
jgi:hypothetical protein